MLPCWRGALLAKAANFKKIPEDIQIKHELDAKNTPKTIEKPFRKIINTKKIANLAIWGPILEPVAWFVPAVARFFFDLFFGTSGGYPLGPILASPGASLVRFVRFLARFQEQNLSQIQRFQSNK